MTVLEALRHHTSELLPEIIRIRRRLHQHPELSFQEVETSRFVQHELQQAGIPFTKGWVDTGIVAQLEGNSPEGPCIALRADLDALPIQEKTKLDFASERAGIMHACGHDVHTACMLGALLLLQRLRPYWNGSVRAVFQPGEEVLPGGASLMLKEGALGDPLPQLIFGQHVFPDLPAGQVGFKSGLYMASADELHITIRGKGGHAALPERLSDPVLMAAHLIVGLQQIVSRNNNPKMPSVLSIGYVKAEGATNVIPDEVHLKGTFRTFDEHWREAAHDRMRELGHGLVTGMGGSVDFDIRKGYPHVENEPAATERAREHARALLGKESVVDLDLRMTAEDFAYYSQVMSACFYRLGTGFLHRENSGLHTGTFEVNEEALRTGMELMAWLAYNELTTAT